MIRRGLLVALAGLLLAGCTGSAASSRADDAVRTAGAAPSDACQPVEHPPLQLGSHLVGDAEPPSPYTSTPPSSGWHSTSVPPPGIADEPLEDPDIVSALEAGLVVVAVSPEVDLAGATPLVEQFPRRLVVTTFEQAMPTPVALLTWGKLSRCDELDPTGVTTFVLTERTSAEH